MGSFNRSRGDRYRAQALLGACGALLAACTVDAGDPAQELGTAEQAVCRTYPECGPDSDPDPDDDPPPPPPPPVSKPDVALQFSPCLPADQAAQVTDAVRAALPTAMEVLTACTSGTQRVAAWFRARSGTDDGSARSRGLNNLSLLQSGETFSGYINSNFIHSTVFATWNQTPKVMSADGRPDSDGPIHLSSLQLQFLAPNKVASIIRGYDERPWPDVDFKLTTTDTLSTVDGRIQCQSESKVDADASWLNYLTGFLGIIFPPLGIYLIIEDAFPSASDASNTTAASVGCPAVRFFPAEIALPFGLKALISYGRASVSSTGIVVGGSYEFALREPRALILGSLALSAPAGELTSSGAFAASARDMRPPLTYYWSSSGTVASPNGSGTVVTFSLLRHNTVGSVKHDSVTLRIVDADGLSAQTTAAVTTTIRRALQDNPICLNKPYLPVCQDL